MPTFTRKYLRQTLGRNHLRDTYVGITTASWSNVAYSVNVLDQRLADLSLSGQGLYAGSWLWFANIELRVASFNVASGALVSTSTLLDAPGGSASGADLERHDMLPPSDKNRALDETIKRLHVRREVGIDSVRDLAVYPMPDGVQDVLSTYYFASPAATLDRVRKELTSAEPVVTATGVELRISPALEASQQIVLDAIVTVTLGAGDAATVNIPDERLVLFGAEAQCWDLLVKRAPRGTADEYRRLRDAAARQYGLLAARFKVPIDRPLRLDESF